MTQSLIRPPGQAASWLRNASSNSCILQLLVVKSSVEFVCGNVVSKGPSKVACTVVPAEPPKDLAMKSKRSCCPVACTLDLIGDRWTLLIIRDLLLGKSHFKEFRSSPEKIATNILTDRLGRLVDHELVERFPSMEVIGKEAYRLTSKGKTLGPIVESMMKWGLKHIDGTDAKLAKK